LKPPKRPLKTLAEKRMKRAVERPVETAMPLQPMSQSKYRHLLDDPDIVRWFLNES